MAAWVRWVRRALRLWTMIVWRTIHLTSMTTVFDLNGV